MVWSATDAATESLTTPHTASSVSPCALAELLPHFVAAIERREARDIDDAALDAVALLLDRLLEHEAGHVVVALLDLGDLRIVEVDVIGDDLDPRVDRLLRDVLQRLGLAVVDDQPVDLEVDRLLDELALGVRVLPRLGDAKIDPERVGLPLGAGLEGLQPVAAADEVDDGDLDAALVERRGRAGEARGLRRRDRENPGGDAAGQQI